MEQGKALKSIKCCRSRRRKKIGESSRNGRVSSHNSGLRSFARKVSWEFFGRWTRISKAFAINFLKCSSDLFSKNVRAATQSQGRVPRVSAPQAPSSRPQGSAPAVAVGSAAVPWLEGEHCLPSLSQQRPLLRPRATRWESGNLSALTGKGVEACADTVYRCCRTLLIYRG